MKFLRFVRNNPASRRIYFVFFYFVYTQLPACRLASLALGRSGPYIMELLGFAKRFACLPAGRRGEFAYFVFAYAKTK